MRHIIIDIWRYTVQSVKRKKKKKYTPLNFNINYRREMKLLPINMNNCPFQFDALKFLLVVHLHGGLNLTLILSIYTTKFFNGIVKFTSQIA